MGEYVDLLRSLPKPKRDLCARAREKDARAVETARRFGKEYFDGDRLFGYGGYRYDGRWRSVVRDIINHYRLPPGARVLDVGCAKGFLVSDMVDAGLDAWGLDVSHYAIVEAPYPDIAMRLDIGSADAIPFPDQAFDLVVSINTLHNLSRAGVVQALREMKRVSRGKMFVQVDSYRTPDEKETFESWVLTARFHDYPSGWLQVFTEAGYDGDYAWTIV